MSEILEIKKTKFGLKRSRRDGRDVSDALIAAVQESLDHDGEERSVRVPNKAQAEEIEKDLDSLKRRHGYQIKYRTVIDDDGKFWVALWTLGKTTNDDGSSPNAETTEDEAEPKTTRKRRTSKSRGNGDAA